MANEDQLNLAGLAAQATIESNVLTTTQGGSEVSVVDPATLGERSLLGFFCQ